MTDQPSTGPDVPRGAGTEYDPGFDDVEPDFAADEVHEDDDDLEVIVDGEEGP